MSKKALRNVPCVELRAARSELDRKARACMRRHEQFAYEQELRIINAEVARRPKLPEDIFK